MNSGNTGNCKIGDYMTHPAFISIPSTGFWIGKFETSKSNTNANNSRNPSGVQIKPNVVSWKSIQVGNAFYTTYDYKRELDSHLLKNIEWGAVSYLQHSEYGSHVGVRFNNNSNYLTGYASVIEPTCGATGDNRDCNKYGTSSTITLPYNTEVGYLASTTGNISGIYDMSGGAWEYVMGVMTDQSGEPLSGQNASSNSGFTGGYGEGGRLTTGYSWSASRYYDKYIYGTVETNYKGLILGDSTGELGPYVIQTTGTQDNKMSSWHSNHSRFIFSSCPWFARGATVIHGIEAGIFAFGCTGGHMRNDTTFRIALTPKK